MNGAPVMDMTDYPGTRPVSSKHRLDESRLLAWLERNLAGFTGPLSVRQFEGGQSNPTFLLLAPSGASVLRKKPPGTLLATAHAIDREYRLLKALEHSDVPVPRARVFCDDDTIIGTPFYVMDFQPGRIFTDPLLPGMQIAERAAIYDAMNDTLARLHRVDWRAAGLGDYGRPEDYFARQIARWRKQYEQTKTEIVPAMESLMAWLPAHIPQDQTATIAHGDFRLGNLIFANDAPRVVAVLDWELSTIGHPLADLAFNCMTYHLPADDAVAPGFVGVDSAGLGIPTELDYVAAYAKRTGFDAAPCWRFAMAFSLFRTAAIQQGIYARSLQGNASSPTAQLFGEGFRRVADAGWRVADAA